MVDFYSDEDWLLKLTRMATWWERASHSALLVCFRKKYFVVFYVIFRELFLRVIDINYEGAEPPSSLYQLRVEQFSKCFVSWSNQNQAFNFPMTSLF